MISSVEGSTRRNLAGPVSAPFKGIRAVAWTSESETLSSGPATALLPPIGCGSTGGGIWSGGLISVGGTCAHAGPRSAAKLVQGASEIPMGTDKLVSTATLTTFPLNWPTRASGGRSIAVAGPS